MNTSTVGEAFIKFLQDERQIGTFGVDLFLGYLPQDAPDKAWLVVVSGGDSEMVTLDWSMVKVYRFSVYYRSPVGKEIEQKLFSLEEDLNCASCVKLEGFETIYARATQYAQDIDLENEERRIGMIEAEVRLFKENTYIS